MSKYNFLIFLLSAVPSLACAQNSIAVGAQTINTLGLSISGYQYREPSLDVVISAPLLGFDYTSTYAFSNDWFVKADARYAYGSAKYIGSGTQSNIPYS